MKKAVLACFVGLVVFGAAGRSLAAHEMTYKGTVASVEAATIAVNVIDDASKKETPMTFGITAKTRIYRGDKIVSLADARLQKDERIAVTVDHDQPGHDAVVLRLAARK